MLESYLKVRCVFCISLLKLLGVHLVHDLFLVEDLVGSRDYVPLHDFQAHQNVPPQYISPAATLMAVTSWISGL